MKTLITSAAVAALLGGAALAQEGQTRQLGAHVHGEARLSVAIDDSGLAFAELTGAAWNFFGFEAEGANRRTARNHPVGVRCAV
jgi:hypothetical protein